MLDNKKEKLLKYVWKDAATRLKKVGIKTALLDSRILLQHILGITYEQLLVSASIKLTDEQNEEYEKLLIRRIKREPVSKILNQKDFWKYQFKTNEFTLDPRPETEGLIDLILSDYKDFNRDLKILDLGTGSGCIILTLLKEYPNATGVGVDDSMEALKVAGENAEKLGVNGRVNFVKANWINGVEGEFDIIVSNPPYIKSEQIDFLPAEVRLYDPVKALDGGASGVEPYKEIVSKVENVMTTHAKVYFEIGKWQEEEVGNIIKESGFGISEIKKDLMGIPRVISFNKPYLKLIN